jgi:hypothetical protein
MLSSAMADVQRLRKKRIAGPKELVTEGINITPDTARSWVKSSSTPNPWRPCDAPDTYTGYSYRTDYFTKMSPKIFPSLKDPRLIDEKLIYLMPDLITMDHVQVDACILVIYYCILWQGCFRLDDNSNSFSSPDPRIIRQILICCLRAVSVWQREATGSITDFIAAMFMVRADPSTTHSPWKEKEKKKKGGTKEHKPTNSLRL